MSCNAVVLAGSRSGERDEIAAAHNIRLKAFAPVGGQAMVERVIAALRRSGRVDDIIVCLPDYDPQTESKYFEACRVIDTEISPARSLLSALTQIDGKSSVLVTTADHALLSPAMIRSFLDNFERAGHEGAAAMLPLETLRAKYPGIRRTKIRLSDGAYKSCNLFYFRDGNAARRAATFWINAETFRKKPWRLALALGPTALVRYMLGRLSLTQAFTRISELCDVQLGSVLMDIPEAALDADSLADFSLISTIADAK